MKTKSLLLKLNPIKYYISGKKIMNNTHYLDVQRMNHREISKAPSRTEIINFLLSLSQGDKHYLEIGVRNPDDNYNNIQAGDIRFKNSKNMGEILRNSLSFVKRNYQTENTGIFF